MLQVIALGQYGVAYARGWATDGRITHVLLKTGTDELRQPVALEPANLQTA